MLTMMMQRLVVSLLLLANVCHGFVATPTRKAFGCTMVQQKTRLFSSEEQQQQPVEDSVDGEPEAAAQQETAPEEEEEEQKQEDPEIAALKEQIAHLETKLKKKRTEAQQARDLAETYTKSGYARKVAEMENMRKARRSRQSSNKYTSQAGVVQSFLPVLDELLRLRETYKEDEFGQKYDGLTGAFQSALKELQVEEFTVAVGDEVDTRRVLVKEEQFSNEHPKGTVIQPMVVGMELQGNVLRMAECVASLGSEANHEEEQKAAATEQQEQAADGEEEEPEQE